MSPVPSALRILTAVAVLVAFPLALVGHAADTEDFSINRLKVILKRNPSNQVIAAHLYIRGGVLNVTKATQGMHPLLFESATKGTAKYSKEVLNADLARMGTEIDVQANRDFTVLSLRCISRHFARSWEIFADAVMNPLLEPKEVELVRERLLSQIRQRQDDPDQHLRELADEQFFSDHPYRLDPVGKEEAVRALTVQEMRKHLKEILVTSKLLLVVVGDVERADLQKKVEGTLGTLPAGNYTAQFPPMVRHGKPDLLTQPERMPTNYIIGSFVAPSIRDPDYYAMSMGISLLQQRVFEEVRTKRNLSYAPAVFERGLLANAGSLYVTAVDPAATLPVMLGEVERLQRELVSAKELRDKITTFLTRYYLQNETNAAQASFLARYELAGLGWKASEDFVQRMKSVTPEQVRAAAQKYIHDIQFVVIGDPAKVDRALFTSK
jgi:zinc protease